MPTPPPEQATSPPTTPSPWRWLRIAITAGLLILVFSRIDLAEFARTLASASLLPLLALIAIIWAQRYLAAIRWWLLLRCNNPGLRPWTVVRITFASDFAGQFLPGAVGVELLRLYGITKATANPAGALSSILLDRILSTTALASLVLVALAAAPRTLAIDPALPWAAAAFLAAGIAAAAAALDPRIRRRLRPLLPAPLASRFEGRLAKLAAAFDQYRGRRGLLAGGLALALLFQFIRILMYALGAVALGLTVPFAALAVFIPIIIFLTLLPISIGGFGVREAAFMYLFASVNVPPEQAVALSLFVSIVHLLCRLPGAWFLAFSHPSRARPPAPLHPHAHPCPRI